MVRMMKQKFVWFDQVLDLYVFHQSEQKYRYVSVTGHPYAIK